MKNLGYSYFDKPTKGIAFEEKGFCSNTEKFVRWQNELLEITYGESNFKLE